MKLAYRAINQSGKMINDVIDADSAAQASDLLHHRGLFVADIQPADEKPAASVATGFSLQTEGKRLKHLAAFARHLYVLLQSGTSITQAMAALERQTHDPKWNGILKRIRSSIEDGSSFAASLAEHPRYFDPITCSLIAAGESSGNLEQMLDRVAHLTRSQLRTRRQIVGALTYPVLVVVVSVAVVAMLITTVLPRFSELFTMMKVPLPPTTVMLMACGDWLRDYWWAALIGVIGGTIGLWRYMVTDAGRKLMHTTLLRLPGIGQVTRSFITARVIRILGVLLGSHVGLLDALRLTRDAAGNHHYAQLLEHAEDAAGKGTSLSQAFSNTDLLSPTVYEAIHNGEQSGTLDTLLVSVAEFMDEDNDIILKSLLSILSPSILALLGVIVGFIAVSLFLPLFDLTAAGAGGGTP